MSQIVKGLGIIFLGLLTLIPGIPVIWIGGFIWGGILIFRGLAQWGQDPDKSKPIYMMPSGNDSSNIVFTCGQCNRKIVIPKGKGMIKTKCLGCSRENIFNT